MRSFKPEGVCSNKIKFEIKDEVIKKVVFKGGCTGNLQGIASLVKGREIQEVIERLSGITCRNGTSCPDQLSKALRAYLERDKSLEAS